jgi:putative sterol carrier protein
MDLQTATAAFRNKVGADSGLSATLKFDCGADGVIVIDGSSSPNTVDNTDRPADCTIALSLDSLAGLMSGDLNPTTAFMTGKIKVSGDMGVALKLQRVL